MGMPPNEGDQLTWYWKREKTFDPQDRTKNPYDWTEAPATDVPGNPDEPDGSLVVDYALEFSARPAGSIDVALGQMDTSRAVVTVMDDDYEKIKTADYAMISNTIYDIDFSGPPLGLFAVGVHTLYLLARDEA